MYREYLKRLEQKIEEAVYTGGSEEITDYEDIMKKLVDIFSEVKKQGKCLFFIGNGGSSAIASHMTADFMKNGGMKTYSLYDSAVTTCMGNDYGYEYVFSRPLSFLGNRDDMLIAVSSSGNSENIILAIEAAHERGMKVLTITGFKPDNRARAAGDFNIYVPCCEYGQVESIHCLILQQVVDEILARDGAQL